MLIIVCGEDSAASRKYYSGLKSSYEKKGYEAVYLPAKELPSINKSDVSLDLFGRKQAYFTEGVNTLIGRQKNDTYVSLLKEISDHDDVILVDWENGKSQRDLKAAITKLGTVKEFKVDTSIFQLLDAIYPSNIKEFSTMLNSLVQSQDEGFIFAMVCKHVRSLILAASNALPSNFAPWQRSKISSQARKWNIEKLILFYEGLARIDIGLKTSNNVYGIKKSIDILACYYLI